MNILMLVPPSVMDAGLVSDLERTGHQVRVITACERALDLIGRDPPDIAIVSRSLAGDAFASIMRAVVGVDELYRAVVALVDEEGPDTRLDAYGSGADEVIVTKTIRAELICRVRSVERIVRLERRLRERVRELESALKRLEMAAVHRAGGITGGSKTGTDAQPTTFLLSPTWDAVEVLLASTWTEYLKAPYQLVAGTSVPAPGTSGTVISLTDVEHELRVELALFAPPASAALLTAAFCGDASMVDDEMIREVMLELANSGMGALKVGLVRDGFRFAASVPKPVAFVDAKSWLSNAEARRILTFRSETTVLHVILAVRRTPRVRVKAALLREGMVLAANVTNEAGTLIIAAGTRLTETSAERLRRTMPKLEIELADVA